MPIINWPMRFSRMGCQGTSRKPNPSSIIAKRPLAREATPVRRPLTYSPVLLDVKGQASLGSHFATDAIHLPLLQICDGMGRNSDRALSAGGIAHFNEALGAALKSP